ncbi:MAG: hypothetical protein F6J93_25835 [Oscillatoria sp. SIO1A7]|nr:hypothetical protein [Oscillatoria sp. SIO1A7]
MTELSIEKNQWLQLALRVKGSVIPGILPRVLFCGFFGLLISILHPSIPVNWPILSSVVPNIVLGLLLVFRTNTAYDRFWEGRKLWGVLVSTARNFSRQVWVAVDEKEPKDEKEKIAALRLIVAFAVALKLHLRKEPVNEELQALMGSDRFTTLRQIKHTPLTIAFWLGDYLQERYNRGCLSIYQLSEMKNLLDKMVDVLGGCERILKTPIPLAYAIHIKQLLLLYCVALPFQLVSSLHWGTGPVVALISFTLFGIEEIGLEIEDPFGHDPNDLPLDAMCTTILRNVEELTSLSPAVRQDVGQSAISK